VTSARFRTLRGLRMPANDEGPAGAGPSVVGYAPAVSGVSGAVATPIGQLSPVPWSGQ
jgi:hypothetical protein